MSRLLQLAARLPLPLRRGLQRLPFATRLVRSGLGKPGGSPPEAGSPRHVVYLPSWLRWGHMPERPHYLLGALADSGHPASFVDLRTPPHIDRGVAVVADLSEVPPTGVLWYVHYPRHADLGSGFDEAVVVYDILDDLSLYERAPEALAGHRALMDRAELVMASSRTLVDRHRAERSDILLVPNGVDVARFETAGERPTDLGEGTIIGYHGAVEEWFDFALLEATARLRPHWRFVVVGPVGATVADRANETGRLPNVDFIGPRTPEEIPAYVAAFDVSAIWFTVTDLTTAVSPLKMYESLAGGTPVVSVPLPEAAGIEGVVTASEPDEFASHLETSMGTRVSAPPDADWSARVALLTDELDRRGLRRCR